MSSLRRAEEERVMRGGDEGSVGMLTGAELSEGRRRKTEKDGGWNSMRSEPGWDDVLTTVRS